MKHLLTIAMICCFAAQAHAQKANVLEEGKSAPNCRSENWTKAEAMSHADLKKVFGDNAPPCPEGMSAFRFRCADAKHQWKVRCEPNQ